MIAPESRERERETEGKRYEISYKYMHVRLGSTEELFFPLPYCKHVKLEREREREIDRYR